MNYIGMDVHKRFTYAVAKDREGNELARDKFDNSEANFKKFLESFKPEETKIVIESTGVWEHIYTILEKMGYQMKLANPVKTKAIAYARVKTDAVDASTLADLLRADLIAESYVPPKEVRQLRELTRLRKVAVKQKNQIENRLHALLTRKGIVLPTKTLCKTSFAFLKKEDDDSIVYYLEMIEVYQTRLKEITEKIENIAYESDDAQLLMTIRGIGPVHSVTLLAEIGEITRFASSDKLCSYAGLVPSVKQSGSTLQFGKLVKQASKTLKHVFIQASWINVQMKESNPIKEHYKKLAQKKGKQKAICGAARKLCCITYAVLKNKEECRYS